MIVNTKKLLSNETFIRIVSLLVAIILWMYVLGIENPQVDKTIRDVPVQVINIANIQNNGLEIISMSDDKIDVKISGRMSEVNNIGIEDISVQLDVSNIYSANEYYIKPEVKANVGGISVINQSVSSVNVYVDYISRVEKNIAIETVGEPSKGYMLSEATTDVNKVIVTGPQRIINRVDSVKATVDVSGGAKEENIVSQLKLYSSNGEEVVSDKIKLSVTDISVNLKFDYFKKFEIVPVFEEVEGFSEEHYNVTLSLTEIDVFGDSEKLKDVEEISATLIDVPYDNEEMLLSREWDATIVLPEGSWVKDDISTIKVKFEKK